jgi:hypothetical protein
MTRSTQRVLGLVSAWVAVVAVVVCTAVVRLRAGGDKSLADCVRALPAR